MDSRKALKNNTTLRFSNEVNYIVMNELARGGTSIVYNAFYYDNINEKKYVRIKECYPFQCNLKRGENDEILVPKSETALFEEAQQKMLQAYQTGSELFRTDGLTNLIVNTYNIFHANNTLYIVSAYSQGQELSYQRYDTVKESIAVVKSVALAIGKIHRKGYLYLDIKPSNIFTLEGTTDLIQLFDFDTLVPISTKTNKSSIDDKISYTKGFAALEQQSGNYPKIGKYSDVYGIGALLFYMLFNRVPSAFDCEMDAKLDYENSKLSGNAYQDLLIFKLTDFFHHTLADYYLDRFSNMEIVVERLTELQLLADLSSKYIHNSSLSQPNLLLGRNVESQWIKQHLLERKSGCFFVTGMGGIGKSSLVRHSLFEWKENIDILLYLNYQDSIEKTISDDNFVSINTIKKDKSESGKDYFNRKLRELQELGMKKKAVLVIDNYTRGNSETLAKLLQLDWIILFITKEKSLSEGFETLEVNRIRDDSDLLELFEDNLGHELLEEEKESALSLIQCVGGHTLLVELFAKQIGSPISCLSVKKAAEIVNEKGFSKMMIESIDYIKDRRQVHSSITQIISDLFDVNHLSEHQKTLLKILSLFGSNGVTIEIIREMLELKSREDLSVLYHQGWITIDQQRITMHPVIEEVVLCWSFSEEAKKAYEKVLHFLDTKLRVEAQKEEYPKKFLATLHKIQEVQEKAPGSLLDKIKRIPNQSLGWTKEIYESRIESAVHHPNTNQTEVKEWLSLAMAALETGKRFPEIQSMDLYKECCYYVIKNTPFENDDVIQEKSEEFISLFNHDNKKMILDIYQCLLEVYYEKGEFDLAREKLAQGKKTIGKSFSPYLWGQYNALLAGVEDALLNGNYDVKKEEEIKLLQHLLKYINRAIRFLRFSKVGNAKLLLGEAYRFKALVLIRSGLGTQKQVQSLLQKVQKIMNQVAQPNSRLMRDTCLTLAWYYTYLEEEEEKTNLYLYKAYEITAHTSTSELDEIEELLSPSANILLEWQAYEDAAMFLILAIKLCDKNKEIKAYQRKRLELMGHLLQVYYYAQEGEQCKFLLAVLDQEAQLHHELNINDYVPLEIREEIAKDKLQTVTK